MRTPPPSQAASLLQRRAPSYTRHVTVTLLFTDIEGSTGLVQSLGDAYPAALEEHRRKVRTAVAAHGGEEIDCRGDEFSVAFRDAEAAVDAARAIQDAHTNSVRVRVGVHSGEPLRVDGGYVGLDVHRAARICAAGHGGQILVSETTRALLGNQLPDGVQVHDLGEQNLKDIQHEHIYELSVDGAPAVAKPLKTQAAPPASLESRLEDRINRYVESQLDRAFEGNGEMAGLAASGVKVAAGGIVVLVMLVVALVAIVLIVKLAFF
jgi:class 3 adenylate cyclase